MGSYLTALVKAHTLTPMLLPRVGILEITNVWRVLFGDPMLAGAAVLLLTKPVPWAQYTIVI